MNNKLLSLAEFKQIDDDTNVIGLLELIKNLIFSTDSTQYKYWTIAQCIRRVMNCKQRGAEDLATFYLRWTAEVEVLESQFRSFVPSNIDEDDDASEEAKKLLACLFLNSIMWQKYGKFIDKLNNRFISGDNKYSVSAEEVVNQLARRTNFENNNHKQPSKFNKNNDNDSEDKLQVNLAQTQDNNKTEIKHTKQTKQPIIRFNN